MVAKAMRCGWVVLLALGTLAAVRADQKEAEEALKAKGLTRRSTHFCVAEEAELTKLIAGPSSEAGKRKKTVDAAQARAVAAKKSMDDIDNNGRQCKQEWDTMNVQLQTLSPGSSQYNKLVERMNVLAAIGNATPGRLQQADKALHEARSEAATQRENFIQYVVQLRQKYDALVERYNQLGQDPQVKKAIDDYSKASNRICSLGPQKTTTEMIRKLEGEVLSDEIPIYPAGGNLWHVFVTINGRQPMEIAIDTGSSLISLPFKDAQTLGMEPTSQSRQITVTLADGRKIQAHEMKADTVRVGKFTVKDVRVGVMPADCTEATPLLGLSFLNHFNYKIDKTRGLLVMATIEEKEKAKRLAGASAKRGDKPSALDQPTQAGAPAEPAAEEPQTPAEKLAKLLPLDGLDEGSRKGTMTLRRSGAADLVFRPCKRGPAKTLQERFGDPDEMRKMPAPGGADGGDKSTPWKLWIWGPVYVLVDETGTTRFFTVDKKDEAPKKEE